MEFSIIKEICTNNEIQENNIVADFCQALDRLRSYGYYEEVYIIENFVSILFIKLLEKYTVTSMYI